MEVPQEEDAHYQTFQGWKDLSRAPRLDVALGFSETLRRVHRNHHVVRTGPYSCDLEGYATAGFAKWTYEYSDNLYEAERDFIAPESRISEDPGTLGDDVCFGRVRYEWNALTFIIYVAEYAPSPEGMLGRHFFILAPQDNKVADGHHGDVDALLLACGRWTNNLHDEIYVFDNGLWCKSEELYKSVQAASWDDVVLDPAIKAKLIEDVQGFFDNRALYESFQVPWKRGVILHGVPGNGKTVSIKALINTLSKRPDPVPSLYVKSFDDRCRGEKWAIHYIFNKARQMAPCVLIFEDLDSLVTRKVRSYFLNEVDGLDSNDGILMIGSTNHLSALDPAIAKRPSRFDRKYHFKLPNEDERLLYSRYWFRKLENHALIAFPEDLCPIIAKLTEHFSFAYIKELFVTSLLMLAHRHGNGEDDDEKGFEEDGPNEDQVEAVPQASDTSSADPVVVDVSLAVAGSEIKTSQTGTDSTKQGKSEDKEAAQKVRKILPNIDVPKSLQGNSLLDIITAQAQLLLDEMDNTEDTPPSTGHLSKDDGDCDDDSD